MLTKSTSMDFNNASLAPASRAETDSDCRSESILERRARTPWPTCSVNVYEVIAGVTFGFPSRSPPIQLPKDSGRAKTSSSIPYCESS